MRWIYKNLCAATVSASIMAVNMLKNNVKNVEYDNNKIFYETLLDFFKQRNGTYFLNKPRSAYVSLASHEAWELYTILPLLHPPGTCVAVLF